MSGSSIHDVRLGARILRRLAPLALVVALVVFMAPAHAADDAGFESLADLLASEAKSAASDAVGQGVESAQEAAVEAVKGDIESRVIHTIARKAGMGTAVAIERAYDGLLQQIDFITEKIEILDYAVEKYTKFANGEYSDLAVDVWKEAVNKIASSEVAIELFKRIGVSSNVVSLAVRALEITADSYLELQKQRAGVRLESLYGAIEQDKRLYKGKKSGRELGSGNPIPVSHEAVDILYKRIVEESGFRNSFKIYVEQELSATFPTPDFFDSMLIAVQTGGGAAAGSAVATETQRALAKNKDEIESWIRALLAQLNSQAKLREASYVAEKQLKEIARAKASLATMRARVAALRASAADAAKTIPEMRAFLAEIPGRVSEAKKTKDDARVRAGRARIREYMLGNVAALPASAERTALVGDFRTAWRTLSAAIKEVGSLVEAQIREDATKQVAELGSATGYSFGSFGAEFNLSIDDLSGPMVQAKTAADLDKAASAATERFEKAYDEYSRAFQKWQSELDAAVSAALKPYSDRWFRNIPPPISEAEYRNQGGLASIARNKVWIPAYAQVQLAEKRRSELPTELRELHRSLRASFEAGERDIVLAMERLEQNYNKLMGGTSGAAALFDSLKGISYAGLPQINPPQWDAARPEKLLAYLRRLGENVANEKQSVDRAKAQYASAEEVVRGLKEGKAVADAIRAEVGGVRRRVAALKRSAQEDQGVVETLARIEQGLDAYDRLFARSLRIDFKMVEDQASAPDTEMAYISGLINQVEALARLLDRYGLASLRRGDAVVQVPLLKNDGDTAGVVVTPAQLLTTQQLAQLPSQLHGAVDKVGLSGFDQKTNVGLRKFIDNEMTKFRAAYTAPAYGIAEGQLVTAADIDALAVEIAKIAPTQSDFYRKVNDTVRSTAFARFEMNASYDGNLGATKVDFGRIAKLTGDTTITGAGRKLVDAINKKVADNKAYLDEQNRKLVDDNRRMLECSEKRGVWASGECNMNMAASSGPAQVGGGAQPGPGAGGPVGAGGQPRPPGAAPTGAGTGAPPAGPPQGMAGGGVPGAPAGAPAGGSPGGSLGQKPGALPPGGGVAQGGQPPAQMPAGGPSAAMSASPGAQPQRPAGPAPSAAATAGLPPAGMTQQPGGMAQQPGGMTQQPGGAALPAGPAGQALQASAGAGSSAQPASRPVAPVASGAAASPASPFGNSAGAPGQAPQASGVAQSAARPVAAGVAPATGTPSPLGAPAAPTLMASAPVGASAPAQARPAQTTAAQPAAAPASPFGSPTAAARTSPSAGASFGTPAASASAQPSAATPAATPAAAPLAARPAQAAASVQSPFGGPSSAPASSMQSPFGGASAAQPARPATAQSPFGGPSTAQASAPSTQAASPVGATAAQTAARPAQGAAPSPQAGAATPAAGAPNMALASLAPAGGAAAPAAGPDPMQQIREMYQRFAEAYQRKDVRGVMKYIANDWKSADGASGPELEDTLSNSFRVFDTIAFQVQGLQIQKGNANEYRVSYQTSLTGKNLKRNLTHQDKANITDTVVIGTDGPKIIKTTGGSLAAK